jgi:hypothetical protein
MLKIYEPEIVVATETWLEEGYSEKEIEMDGYDMF